MKIDKRRRFNELLCAAKGVRTSTGERALWAYPWRRRLYTRAVAAVVS